jgi:hypothetical protein
MKREYILWKLNKNGNRSIWNTFWNLLVEFTASDKRIPLFWKKVNYSLIIIHHFKL